jgi:chaperonin GroEL (HSP60 family)
LIKLERPPYDRAFRTRQPSVLRPPTVADFLTDLTKMEATHVGAFVLISDRKINVLKDLLPVLDQVAKSGRPLVLISEDIEG